MQQRAVYRHLRKTSVDKVKFMQVLYVRSITGQGVEEDPVRAIHEIYDMAGNLIVRVDPWGDAREKVVRAEVLSRKVTDIFKEDDIRVTDLKVDYSPIINRDDLSDVKIDIEYLLNGKNAVIHTSALKIIQGHGSVMEYFPYKDRPAHG